MAPRPPLLLLLLRQAGPWVPRVGACPRPADRPWRALRAAPCTHVPRPTRPAASPASAPSSPQFSRSLRGSVYTYCPSHLRASPVGLLSPGATRCPHHGHQDHPVAPLRAPFIFTAPDAADPTALQTLVPSRFSPKEHDSVDTTEGPGPLPTPPSPVTAVPSSQGAATPSQCGWSPQAVPDSHHLCLGPKAKGLQKTPLRVS